MALAFQSTMRASMLEATFGLVVLKTDETIEHEFRRFIPDDGVVMYHSRVESAPEVTPETLAKMREDLPRAVSMLPETAPFDVIGYGCTSGATVIGPSGVADGVHRHVPGVRGDGTAVRRTGRVQANGCQGSLSFRHTWSPCRQHFGKLSGVRCRHLGLCQL